MPRQTCENLQPVNKQRELSGSEKSKKRKLIEGQNEQLRQQMKQFLSSCSGSAKLSEEVGAQCNEQVPGNEAALMSVEPAAESCGNGSNLSNENLANVDEVRLHVDYQTEGSSPDTSSNSNKSVASKDQDVKTSFSASDPSDWPASLNHTVRRFVTQTGPIQIRLDSYPYRGEHRFHEYYYYYKNINHEKLNREWLIYSESTNSLFCFPCCLFSEPDPGSSSPWNNFGKTGFVDFAHLSRGIKSHEQSKSHYRNMISWKAFIIRESLHKSIDSEAARLENETVSQMKSVLHAVIDTIKLLAKCALAFRGSSDKIEDRNCGNFLSVIQMLSKYHSPLAHHIKQHSKGQVSYLSPQIQNEFISIISASVRKSILRDIQERKYFSIQFDATPDCSRKEQLSQIIRTVRTSPEGCVIEENFIDFIHYDEKTGEQLATIILDKLNEDGMDILNCRGQCYDNGANMAGVKKGVQSRIKEVNGKAYFIPCAAHSLNLVGQNAVSDILPAKLLLGQIQVVYNFFSGAPNRWATLNKYVRRTVKSQSSTRWSAKANAVSVLKNEFSGILKALENITESQTFNCATVAEATCSLKQMFNFQFLVGINIWNVVLDKIDRVNKCLQELSTDVDRVAKLLDGLLLWLKAGNYGFYESLWIETIKQAEETGIPLDSGFPTRRTRGRRPARYRDDGEAEQDIEAAQSNKEKYFDDFFKPIMSKLIAEFEGRFLALQEIKADFSFMWGSLLSTLPATELQKHAKDLAMKYNNDIDVVEFLNEIEFLKYAITPFWEEDLEFITAKDVLNIIMRQHLEGQFKNCWVALRIFLTMPVTVASNERAFSKLKIIKNYLRSSMGQERLSNLSILSIENDRMESLSFDAIIHDFCVAKCRRVKI